MGVMLDPKKLSATKELMPYIFSGIVLMIGVSVVVAWSLSERYGFSLVTAFLAMAPGGIAEMCLTAKVLKLGVPLVTSFQVTRLAVVITCSLPLWNLFRRLKNSEKTGG